MRHVILSVAWTALAALALPGCSGSSTSPSSTSAATGTLVNDVLTGTVSIPANGALQSSSNPFTVTASGQSVAVTLTSAVETLPDGSLLPTVAMGLAVGTWANGVCSPLANAFTIAQGSSTPQLSGTISSGAYCVQVSDVSSLLGPVAYAVAVSHY